jgi:hypothetical protein
MTNIDFTNITPEQLAAMQAEAKAKLPTVMTREELAEFQRKSDAEDRKKAQEAEAKKREDARRAQLQKAADRIVDALRAKAPGRKFRANVGDDGASVREAVDRYSYLPYIDLSLEREKTYSRFSYGRYNGKVRVSVGQLGDRAAFPQRKDGTHSYDKIAELAVAKMLREESSARSTSEMESNREANKAGAEALAKELGLAEYYGPMRVAPSSMLEKPVFVKVNIERAMTYTEAKKLHAALVALNIVDAKKGE